MTGACKHAEDAGETLNEEVFKNIARIFDQIHSSHIHVD